MQTFEHTPVSPESHLAPAALAGTLSQQEPLKPEPDTRSLLHFPIQRKLSIGAVDDPLEDEADAMADKIMRMPEQNFIQRKCAHCEKEEKVSRKLFPTPVKSFIQTKDGDPGAETDSMSHKIDSAKGNGNSMNAITKSFMEDRFGANFSNVRIHTGNEASQMSDELHAQAFTAGDDIYFNAGKYAPQTDSGKKLLAHELTHVIQQSGSSDQTMVQKQGDNASPATATTSTPVIPVPGTSLTLMPGPLRTGLLGSNIPLPASLRLTNALGMGAGPSYILDLSPRMVVLHLLQNIDLQTSLTEGTPPDGAANPDNIQRISLINPTVSFNTAAHRLSGSAVLSIPTRYPLIFKGPSLVDVQISSTEPGRFSGTLGYGPLHADMDLRLHYNMPRLERAVAPAFAPSGGFSGALDQLLSILNAAAPGGNYTSLSIALESFITELLAGRVDVIRFVTRVMNLINNSIPAGADINSLHLAVSRFANEIAHPGFSIAGGLRLGFLPLTGFSAEAPTTVPFDRPLTGAPTAYPLRYSAYGAVIAPKGSLFDTAVPALGYTYSNFEERTGTSFTSALLPTMSPSAISAGRPLAERFPVYAYVSFSRVQRISNNVDLGLRLTVQLSTAQLFGGSPPTNTTVNDAIGQYQDAANNRNQADPVPNVGATLFGTF